MALSDEAVRHYKKAKVFPCAQCGCVVVRRNHQQRYCSNCGGNKEHKRRYNNKHNKADGKGSDLVRLLKGTEDPDNTTEHLSTEEAERLTQLDD